MPTASQGEAIFVDYCAACHDYSARGGHLVGGQAAPDLTSLAVLENPWVMGIAAVGALAEFFADKVMWLDSAWDAIHTAVRPVGGALLALAIVDPSDPATQVVAFLLGGGASFLAHGGKASARAVVNTSPEPVSNAVVSSGEDVATAGLLFVAFQYPLMALGIAAVLLLLVLGLLWATKRVLKRFARE